MDSEHQRPFKRRKLGGGDGTDGIEAVSSQQDPEQDNPIRHLLYIRWFGGQGQTKLNKLPLRQIDNLEALEVGVQYAEQHTQAFSLAGLPLAGTSRDMHTCSTIVHTWHTSFGS